MARQLFEACLDIDPARQTVQELKVLPAQKGVILFADPEDKPIQLLLTANIRRTAAARLFPPEATSATKRADITQITRRIHYTICYNDFRTSLQFYTIAGVLYPDTYAEMLALPKQTFVRIDPGAKWPFFTLTESLRAGDSEERIFGPFPTRKSAGRFVGALQGAFRLCQRPDLVDIPEKARSCPYLQMGTCPAPCVGNISRGEYLGQIEGAIAAAEGDIEPCRERIEARMKQLAGEMEFEQAEMAKKRIEQLEVLTTGAYRWTGDLRRLGLLHIDRSAKVAQEGKKRKVQCYAAFLIRYGQVTVFHDFTLDKMGGLCRSLQAKLAQEPGPSGRNRLGELMSLLSYFLYRSKQPGIWLDCASVTGPSRVPAASEIREAMGKHFDVKSKIKN